jgi:PTS system nitrogen regulatory IIA component
MEMTSLIADSAVLPAIEAHTIQKAFKELGLLAHRIYGLDAALVAERLMQREKLGSTASGGGIAIPHAHVPDVQAAIGLFARLSPPVAFQAADGQNVDLVLAVLTPEESLGDHLRALAQASRLLADPGLQRKLRETDNARALYALLTEPTELPNWAQPPSSAIAAQ